MAYEAPTLPFNYIFFQLFSIKYRFYLHMVLLNKKYKKWKYKTEQKTNISNTRIEHKCLLSNGVIHRYMFSLFFIETNNLVP